MTVTVFYFARLREEIGCAREAFELPAESCTVGELLDRLRGRDPRHAAALDDRRPLRAAVNQRLCGFDMALRAGDEVALFPPVTGG